MHVSVRVWPATALVGILMLFCVASPALAILDSKEELGVDSLTGLIGEHRRQLLNHLLGDQEELTKGKGQYDFSGFPTPYLTVQGDTLSSIADRHLLSVTDLLDSNPHLAASLDNPSTVLPVGLALNVRGLPAVPPLPTTISVHDSSVLEAFAAAYNINMTDFQAWNDKVSIEGINKLTTLHVPTPAHYRATECPQLAVCVKAGQTLMDIARMLSGGVEELLLSNPHVLKQGGRLYVGQALNAPGVEPVAPDTSVAVQADQSPYTAFLTSIGMPITLDYLKLMAQQNSIADITEIVTVGAKATTLETVDTNKADLAVLMNTGCNKPAAPTFEEPRSTVRRRLTNPFSKADGRVLQAYSRGLQDDTGAPIVSRLHRSDSHDLAATDAESTTIAARRLHTLLTSKDVDSNNDIASAAKRLFRMLHSEELVPQATKVDGRKLMEGLDEDVVLDLVVPPTRHGRMVSEVLHSEASGNQKLPELSSGEDAGPSMRQLLESMDPTGNADTQLDISAEASHVRSLLEDMGELSTEDFIEEQANGRSLLHIDAPSDETNLSVEEPKERKMRNLLAKGGGDKSMDQSSSFFPALELNEP